MGQGLYDIRLLGRERRKCQGAAVDGTHQTGNHNDKFQEIGNHLLCNKI